MRKSLPTLVIGVLLGTFLLLGACKKDDKTSVPAALTGAIAGKVLPVGAVSNVTASDGGGRSYSAAPSDSSGAFLLNNVAPGTYTVSFTPTGGFVAPANRTATVAAGNVANVGTVSPGNTGGGGSGITYRLNGGATITATSASGILQANTLILLGLTAEGTMLTLNLVGLSGPGSYALTSGGSFASYRNAGNLFWSTSAGGSGTVLVSDFDATNRKISGVFTFTANRTSGSSPDPITVTNGTFTDITYQ